MKKTLLTTTALALLSAGVMAQGSLNLVQPTKANTPVSSLSGSTKKTNRCGTVAPSAEWDAAFNKDVEAYKAKLENDMVNGRTTATTFTIPIIFHIIHGGQAVGTFPNLAAAQVNSQITVLNQDYGGTGYQSSTYPATAFKAYAAATTNSVSVASKDGSGRVAIANTGISFCAATKDPSGATLTEPGIDRINYTTKGWNNPNSTTYSTTTTFQSYIDGTIKPGSIWDPTKYFNVWLTDENGNVGLLGYSTFPPGSTLTGIPGSTGTATTDGCWFWSKVCGSKNIYAGGSYDPTYCYGRTICHECGHYLGLRHPWGDNGQCGATDYCNDTPPEQGQATYQPFGCWYGTNTYPVNAGACNFGGQTNTDGDMFMNIMDYTDDIGMYMFTNDQAIRMQTAMSNSPNRKNLTASSANLCAGGTVSSPVAGFTYPSSICANVAAAFSDASTGPAATYTWSSNPSAGVVITTVNSANPNITFPSAATYTVTQSVTNNAGSNSASHVITVTSCTTAACDTVSNINAADTLTFYRASQGYLSGNALFASSGTVTTTYTNKAIGEVYSKTTFPSNVTQVKGAMLLFFRNVAANVGTKGTSTMTLKMTNTSGAGTSMVPSTSVSATQTLSLASVVGTASTWGVDFAGNGLFNMTGYFIAYPVMFATPINIPTTFGLTLTLPTVAGDTAVVWSNDKHTANTAGGTGCVQLLASTGGAATWLNVSPTFNLPISFGIVPIVCPPTIGIEQNELGSSINLFPNPNSGQFSFAITLPEATNLNFTIINMLGQVVYSKSENSITNAVINCDLSHLAKGVYYASITDSKNNKTVKKIIIE